MVPTRKGTIDPIFSVHCGGCSQWIAQEPTRRDAADFARRLGWRLTRRHGWMCKFCKSGVER